MTLSRGTRVGPYEVLSSLGAGGMGKVYRARDTKLDRDVAIKILPESFAVDADRYSSRHEYVLRVKRVKPTISPRRATLLRRTACNSLQRNHLSRCRCGDPPRPGRPFNPVGRAESA